MHRGLVVIDDRVGYTGSMNMVDPRFFKQDAGVGQWVDIMIRVQGPVVPADVVHLRLGLGDGDRRGACSTACSTSPRPGPQTNYRPSSSLQALSSGGLHPAEPAAGHLSGPPPSGADHLYFVPDDPLAAALLLGGGPGRAGATGGAGAQRLP